MANKNKQFSTEKANISKETGLTPLQEQTAILLASGENITDVAEKLSLNRGTIYKWQKQITFRCFFNRQCSNNRSALVVGLFGLANSAYNAIRDCLQSDNEAIRLKVAMWLTEKIQDVAVGEIDITTAIKKECTYDPNGFNLETECLDEKQYQQKLKQLGIED